MQLTGLAAIFFYLFALMALSFSIGTILARSAVHSALCLMSTLISIAGIFLLLQAEFIAGVQILVYVGGILVLFLFVVMLVNVREEPKRYTRQLISGSLCAILLILGLLGIFLHTQRSGFFYVPSSDSVEVSTSTNLSSNTRQIGQELYTVAVLPFEIASILLLVAIIGAVRLARERKQEQLYD